MRRPVNYPALGIALALLFAATPARAALTLCNRTSYVLYAATAAVRGPQAQTQGWTRLAPGECQVARKEELTAGTWLVHARSSLAHGGAARAWGGKVPLCVKDTDFHLTQPGKAACKAEGSFALPFAALDTGGRHSWTMTLDETPALASLVEAQLAGVRRLLRDNGYQTGPLDGPPDKRTGAALAAFRKKARLPERTGNEGLFRALEAEAGKANAPAGYTVCNDGGAVLDVALGEAGHGKAQSRGWWTLPPGACARLLTTPLSGDGFYLLARRKDGKVIVGGAEKFCIAPTAFEIAARGDCAKRDQIEAGFLPTPREGGPGLIVHVGNEGVAAAPAQPPSVRR
jgi:uncharacterized membrane protein